MQNRPKRLLIWGGGLNFRRALPLLRSREQSGEIQIVGVVDHIRPESGLINGYPHIKPKDIWGWNAIHRSKTFGSMKRIF